MLNPAMFEGLLAGQTISGEAAAGEVAEMKKALEAGYGSDVATLQGGGALRIQSLDKTMKAVIQENRHFALFNELQKTNATATVDEWTEQSGVGGFLGGSTNSELGIVNQATGQYNRRVGKVKFLMTRREVSYVTTIQNNIVDAQAVEAQNGALQLLTDAEFLAFEGDERVVPTEFDGINVQLESLQSADHVIDARGEALRNIDHVDRASATIAGFGNFGTPTHIFCSQLVQSDFNTYLDPAFRVALTNNPGGSVQIGAPVVGVRTSWGDIKNCPDVFIRDEAQMKPFELEFPSLAAANTWAPAQLVAGAGAGGADSFFDADWAGNYFYAVAGVNAKGQSVAVVSSQVAVAAGQAVTLTITRSVGQQETGYVIYRGRKNGTGQIADLRQMARIPASGMATTVYVDKNRDLPGATKAYILNMSTGGDAIAWRQLLPMTKFPLYPTNTITLPWAQLLFGYLRIAKRRQHVIIKNIVPTNAKWKPQG